ncbi:serine acetyltransferase [Altererythrobacter sp. BO-6]|uniref:serine O-acetyltransferase n=1 Tax=Altererythrobacter sp. BO-6 TaxID=2604537 RepID=UPI0013E11ED6|nr:serine O-acetyltransferase [Altererythrobacter sp. BO-6]QIG54267.1 serine acetyltransferase [Altererythrobacter sp. BO-6]
MINAIQVYRVGRWAFEHRIPIIPRLLDYVSRLLFSCWIPHRARIGRNVIVGYGGLSIVIHDEAIIGEGTEIDQGVTIGGNARGEGVAKIGNHVYIGAGAKILGPITIGDGAVIGANAVVTRDVPPSCVAVGVPARIVRTNINASDYLYHRANH